MPGSGSTETAHAQASDPVGAPVEPVDTTTGIAGAAMCISSAYYLADVGAVPEDDATAFAGRWTSIIEIIPATQANARQEAVDDAYTLFSQLDADGSNSGFEVARAQFENDTCTNTAFQRQYVERWGDAALMGQRLEGGAR
ncbi:MAG: hypothetical protein AAF829_10835 [Pseudomonadota bacterium]